MLSLVLVGVRAVVGGQRGASVSISLCNALQAWLVHNRWYTDILSTVLSDCFVWDLMDRGSCPTLSARTYETGPSGPVFISARCLSSTHRSQYLSSRWQQAQACPYPMRGSARHSPLLEPADISGMLWHLAQFLWKRHPSARPIPMTRTGTRPPPAAPYCAPHNTQRWTRNRSAA
jgi:hypothetical protein